MVVSDTSPLNYLILIEQINLRTPRSNARLSEVVAMRRTHHAERALAMLS
jgi:hypothetical protein